MAGFEPERCYTCKKLFCCEDCCINHIKKKHPDRESHRPSCPICRNEPLTIRKFDSELLLYHVVFHHLPLHCRTCGELFKTFDDLKNLSKCNRHPLIIIEPPTFIESSKSTLSIHTPTQTNKTSFQSSISENRMSISGDYNSNFDHFTSPPESTRTTSTPMHINIMKKNYNQYKKLSQIPDILLTTPTFSITDDSIKNNFSIDTPNTKFNSCESVYNKFPSSIKVNLSEITPLKPTLSIKSTPNYIERQNNYSTNNSDKKLASMEELDESKVDEKLTSTCNEMYKNVKLNLFESTPLKSILSVKSTPTSIDQKNNNSKNISMKKLDSMEELDENEVDMELTDGFGAIYTEQVTPPWAKDIQKSEKELKDSGKRVRFIDEIHEQPEFESNFDASETEEFYEARQSINDTSMSALKDSNTTNTSIETSKTENYKNAECEMNNDDNDHHDHKKEMQNSDLVKNQDTKNESTSRVVMMVLVEQSDLNQPSNLLPLIDSSLKKLGSILTKSTSLANNTASLNEEEIKKFGNVSMVSVDSYTKVTTVECFKVPDATSIPEKNPSTLPSISGNGIFSAVANAVRNVFRNLTEVASSRILSTDTTSSKESAKPTTITQLNTPSQFSGITANSTMNSSSRPGKRSFNEIESTSIKLQEMSGIQKDISDEQHDIQSPLQKRPRIWYKHIRGREPIPRMKNSFSSPRGISFETQCFQQGTLTVGNTIISLPSRAYPSTET